MNKKRGLVFGILLFALVFSIFSFGIVSANIKFTSCIDYEEGADKGGYNPTIKGYIFVEYEEDGVLKEATLWDSCGDVESVGAVNSNPLGGGGQITTGTQKSLTEYWCKNSFLRGPRPVKDILQCEVGKHCDDGACVGGLSCNETDEGKEDYPTYGRAAGWDPFEKKYVDYEDVCLTDDEIRESYCSLSGEALREYALCENGCAENVCIEPAENGNTLDCNDTDGGIDASATGTVIGLKSIQNSLSWNFTDTCTIVNNSLGGITNVAVEGYCSENGEVNTIWVNCPGDCVDGSCAPATPVSVCVDTDNGKNYTKFGTVTGDHHGIGDWSLTDGCYTTYNGQKSYMQEGYCENNEAKYINVPCIGPCVGATCNVEGSGATVYDCDDTDFGKNYWVNGTTTGMHEGDLNWVHEDTCYVQNVIEGYCDGFGNVRLINYACGEDGCDNGACIETDSGTGTGNGQGNVQGNANPDAGVGEGDAGLGEKIKTRSQIRKKILDFFRSTVNSIRMG